MGQVGGKLGDSLENRVREEEIREEISSVPVVLFTKGSHLCKESKHLLQEGRIDYQEHDLAALEQFDYEEYQAIVNGLCYVTKSKVMPQIFICQTFIGGFSELQKLYKNGGLKDEIARCSD